MAHGDKCCTCYVGGCDYNPVDMKAIKRKHIQVNKECRKHYHGVDAIAYIVDSKKIKGLDTYRSWCVPKFGFMDLRHDEDYKVNGKIYNENIRSYRANLFYVGVYLPATQTYHFSEIDRKDMRAFKRNMRRMLGYDIPMVYLTDDQLTPRDATDDEYVASYIMIEKLLNETYEDYEIW